MADQKPKGMSPDDLASAVKVFADEARAWNQTQAEDRIKAIQYYDGVMHDTPSDANRSSVVSRDFRAATKKVLPAITRTILGSARVVEYVPMQQGDEESAAQATDYVNAVILPECNGESVIRDAVHDALRVRNGIVKYWWDEKTDVKVTKHSGLTPEEVVKLLADDQGNLIPDIEILGQGKDDQGLAYLKLRRTIKSGKVAIACIPAEDFYISPDALTIEDAPFVAHNQTLKRYQLIAMGYDRDKVMLLKSNTQDIDKDAERAERREFNDADYRKAGRLREMDEIDYWECFVRLDADDDGISELRRVVMAGGWTADNILEDEETDEIPFADIVIERKPHEWCGRSLFDDVYEIQRVKTVLLRNTLDNIYWQNNLQPTVQEGALTVQGEDAIMNPAFGKPIKVKAGYSAADAVQFNPVPFVAQQAFDMLGYMDDALTDRTGIADNSGGLPPDALQNVTAKASALMEQQGINQVELMVRNVAVGLKRVFRGVLKMLVQHQDKARTVRLRDQWVEFDPRSWNAEMDASVNVGLGAGTRERDMMAMQMIVGLQKEVIAGMGPDNPYVKPDQLYNGISKMTQAAGVQHVDAFFTKPNPEEIAKKMQEMASKPSPEQQKAQAQMQLEQAKGQTAIQIEQQKAQIHLQLEQHRMEVDANKEREQRDADLIVKQKELENNLQIEMARQNHTQQLEMERLALQREKMAQDLQIAVMNAELTRQANADKADAMWRKDQQMASEAEPPETVSNDD